MYAYSPDIPVSSANFTLITPRYWNSLFHTLISQGRMQRIFFRLKPFTQCQFSFHPLLLGGQRFCGFKACRIGGFYARGALRNQIPYSLILGPTPKPLNLHVWYSVVTTRSVNYTSWNGSAVTRKEPVVYRIYPYSSGSRIR